MGNFIKDDIEEKYYDIDEIMNTIVEKESENDFLTIHNFRSKNPQSIRQLISIRYFQKLQILLFDSVYPNLFRNFNNVSLYDQHSQGFRLRKIPPKVLL